LECESFCRVERNLLPNKLVDLKFEKRKKKAEDKNKHEDVIFDVTFGFFPEGLCSDSIWKAAQLPALECEVSLACPAVVSHSLLNKQH